MAEGSGLNKTQVWVAVITVVGGLLTAIIVNADKWISRDEKAAVVASPSAATPTQPGPAASTPPMANSTAPAPVTASVDIGGEWRDDDGSRFGFTQSGSQYEYRHTAINGTFQSVGRGTISGRVLSHTFETATGETGRCTARLNAAANRITGNCLNSGGGWTFAIER